MTPLRIKKKRKRQLVSLTFSDFTDAEHFWTCTLCAFHGAIPMNESLSFGGGVGLKNLNFSVRTLSSKPGEQILFSSHVKSSPKGCSSLCRRPARPRIRQLDGIWQIRGEQRHSREPSTKTLHPLHKFLPVLSSQSC